MLDLGSCVINFPARFPGLMARSRIRFYLLVPTCYGNKSVLVFVTVLDRLNTEEHRTEEHRQQDQDDLHISVALLGVVNGQRHRQTADDEDQCIESAPE